MPSFVQVGFDTVAIADGSAYSMASNATVGNTVVVFTDGATTAGQLTSTFGAPSQKIAAFGNGTVGYLAAYLIPVKVASQKTITLTGGGTYDIWAAELAGSWSMLSVPTASGTTANPALSLIVATGQVAVAAANGASSAAATAFTGSPGTWTDTNSPDWTWTGFGDIAYCLNGAVNQTATWTKGAAQWFALGMVLTPATGAGDGFKVRSNRVSRAYLDGTLGTTATSPAVTQPSDIFAFGNTVVARARPAAVGITAQGATTGVTATSGLAAVTITAFGAIAVPTATSGLAAVGITAAAPAITTTAFPGLASQWGRCRKEMCSLCCP